MVSAFTDTSWRLEGECPDPNSMRFDDHQGAADQRLPRRH
jgi:hypothetical protein